MEAKDVVVSLIDSGFTMTPGQMKAFVRLYRMLQSSIPTDRAAYVRMQEVYDHLINNLSVESFMDDPNGNDMADRKQANDKFN